MILSEKLGRLPDELSERMDGEDLEEWRAFLEWRHEVEEEQIRKARAEAKSGRR